VWKDFDSYFGTTRDGTSGKGPLKGNLVLYYSWQYIHIDAIHTGTGVEGVVGAIPNINYKNEKPSLYSHRLRPLVTYVQDINDTSLLWGTFSCICEMQSSDSVSGVERRDRTSDILTHLRETEPFAGNEHWGLFNILKSTDYVMHQQVKHSTIVRTAHTVFMYFVFISEQTGICATYSTNWSVFITEMKCLQRGTNWVFK